jgi:hypothetical protein
MGPVSMSWYRTRGLTQTQTKIATENSMFTTEGESFTSESITTHYSCGRIDVHNVPSEPYGDEINVPPMLSTDWALFSNWLETVKTMSTWTLADLVTAYQQHNPPITWDTYDG